MRKRDNVHKKKALRTIYVLIFSDNGFFINHTTQKNMRDVYKDHYNLKWNWSKNQMAADKEKGYIPQMFILEEDFDGTKAETFSRIVAWGRLLQENGYTCTNGETFSEYINDLVPRTQQYYDDIKNEDVGLLLDDFYSLFPDYGARNRPKPEPVHYNTVKVKFTDHELKMLKVAAEIYDQESVADMCRFHIVDALPDMLGEFYKPE